MKLNVLSDLHLGFGAMDWPVNDADVVVLAGDISRPREAIAWALRFDKPVLYVPGNHEFYGSSIDGALEELQRLCEGTQVQVLDNRELVMSGVRFLGSTLWTDFELFDDPQQRTAAMSEARRLMRDFSRIRARGSSPEIFTPEDSVQLFRRHSAWLESRLAHAHAGPTVVITHHAPSRHSIHPRFDGSLLNACFVSDAAHLLHADRVSLWIHGHTHDSFDHQVNGTRVVCNPRGYARAGVNENPTFDADFIVEVEAPTAPGGCSRGPANDALRGDPHARRFSGNSLDPERRHGRRGARGTCHPRRRHGLRTHHEAAQPPAVPHSPQHPEGDADAEDAVQEADLRAWRALGSFRPEARRSTSPVRIVCSEGHRLCGAAR